MSRQDRATQLNVETPFGQRVIDGMAGKLRLSVPKLHEFVDMRDEHVVAEDAVKIGGEIKHVAGFTQRQGLSIDFEHPYQFRAGLNAVEIREKKFPQGGDAVPPPFLELDFDAAVIFQPECNRGERERICIVDFVQKFIG